MSQGKSAQQKSQKTLIIAVIVAVILLGAVVLSLLLLKSPERQLASGLSNLVTAETIAVDGTVISSSQAGKTTAKLQAVTDKQAVDGKVALEYVATKGAKLSGAAQIFANQEAAYIKLDQPRQLVDDFATYISQSINIGEGVITQEVLAAQTKLIFSSTADKIDSKWVKITQADLKNAGSDVNTDCYTAFATTLASNKKASSQLASAYRQYQFFVITDNLKPEGSSTGYHISIDDDKLQQFQAAVKDNDAVKKLGSCGVDVLSLGVSAGSAAQGVDVWVDKISNNITRVKYTKTLGDGESTKVDLKLSYDKSVKTTPPKDAVDFKSILPSMPGVLPAQQ